MKIKILKNTVCGGERVKKGKVVDASEQDARYLCNIGKAEPADKAAKEATEEPKE